MWLLNTWHVASVRNFLIQLKLNLHLNSNMWLVPTGFNRTDLDTGVSGSSKSYIENNKLIITKKRTGQNPNGSFLSTLVILLPSNRWHAFFNLHNVNSVVMKVHLDIGIQHREHWIPFLDLYCTTDCPSVKWWLKFYWYLSQAVVNGSVSKYSCQII